MIVTRKSLISGKITNMDIAITEEELIRIDARLELIQNIVPHLDIIIREFLKTGMTIEEQDLIFNQ